MARLEPFDVSMMSRNAIREARRENIPIELIAATYDDPDERRVSQHDDLREIRSRWFERVQVEIVVDTLDGRVVTVWRKGATA